MRGRLDALDKLIDFERAAVDNSSKQTADDYLDNRNSVTTRPDREEESSTEEVCCRWLAQAEPLRATRHARIMRA